MARNTGLDATAATTRTRPTIAWSGCDTSAITVCIATSPTNYFTTAAAADVSSGGYTISAVAQRTSGTTSQRDLLLGLDRRKRSSGLPHRRTPAPAAPQRRRRPVDRRCNDNVVHSITVDAAHLAVRVRDHLCRRDGGHGYHVDRGLQHQRAGRRRDRRRARSLHLPAQRSAGLSATRTTPASTPPSARRASPSCAPISAPCLVFEKDAEEWLIAPHGRPATGSALPGRRRSTAVDLASLANGSTVLSSVADITNQTALDIYADISVRMTVDLGDAAGRRVARNLPGGIARRRRNLWRRVSDFGRHDHPRAAVVSCRQHPTGNRRRRDQPLRLRPRYRHTARQLPLRPLQRLRRSAQQRPQAIASSNTAPTT